MLVFIPKHHGLSHRLWISILLFPKSSVSILLSFQTLTYIQPFHSLFHFSEFFFFPCLFSFGILLPFISFPFCKVLISVNRSTSFLPSDIGRGEATKRLSHELKRAFCSPCRTRRMLPTSFRQCLRAKHSSLASLSVPTIPRPAGHQSSRT